MAEEKKNEQAKPKIIVDDDWKTQAQADKAKLAEEVESKAEAKQQPAQTHELPQASFPVLVNSLMTQIFFSLGAIEDPQTKKRFIDLALAKHHIDMLAVLEEKTKGNLSEEESKLLDQVIYETRMQYVQVAQHVSKAQ